MPWVGCMGCGTLVSARATPHVLQYIASSEFLPPQAEHIRILNPWLILLRTRNNGCSVNSAPAVRFAHSHHVWRVELSF